MAPGATCVQRLGGSRDPAIHTKYRISLRSSSMREPRYPLPRVVVNNTFIRQECSAPRTPRPGRGAGKFVGVPWRALRRGFVWVRARRRAAWGQEPSKPRPPRHEHGRFVKRVRGSFDVLGIDNDPSAGSPTETLLRLLLPLNDKVQWTSRDVAGSEPPTSPRSEHFTGPFNR